MKLKTDKQTTNQNPVEQLWTRNWNRTSYILFSSKCDSISRSYIDNTRATVLTLPQSSQSFYEMPRYDKNWRGALRTGRCGQAPPCGCSDSLSPSSLLSWGWAQALAHWWRAAERSQADLDIAASLSFCLLGGLLGFADRASLVSLRWPWTYSVGPAVLSSWVTGLCHQAQLFLVRGQGLFPKR